MSNLEEKHNLYVIFQICEIWEFGFTFHEKIFYLLYSTHKITHNKELFANKKNHLNWMKDKRLKSYNYLDVKLYTRCRWYSRHEIICNESPNGNRSLT